MNILIIENKEEKFNEGSFSSKTNAGNKDLIKKEQRTNDYL